jgi:maleylpyruvate isomerase
MYSPGRATAAAACDAVAMDADLARRIGYVRDATKRLLAGLAAASDADVVRPSLCPGWTVGKVLTHVARSADGLRRSVEGAKRGELVPPYVSLQARDADIEAGAARPIAALAADVAQSAQALDDAWAGLGDAGWDREMPHHRLGKLPLRDTPGLRWGEVEIHHVDLAGSYHPRDWPAAFVAHALGQTAGTVAGRLPPGVALEVTATDTGGRWAFGPEGARRAAVSGPSWAIAAWFAGRPAPAASALSVTGGELTVLGPWR